jgi:predicted RND superfamily exporter protein
LQNFDDSADHCRGLTIDTVSSVNLIIAIGLCVDYSAHIAHGFLVEQHGADSTNDLQS